LATLLTLGIPTYAVFHEPSISPDPSGSFADLPFIVRNDGWPLGMKRVRLKCHMADFTFAKTPAGNEMFFWGAEVNTETPGADIQAGDQRTFLCPLRKNLLSWNYSEGGKPVTLRPRRLTLALTLNYTTDLWLYRWQRSRSFQLVVTWDDGGKWYWSNEAPIDSAP
jgi:hypothetical protein